LVIIKHIGKKICANVSVFFHYESVSKYQCDLTIIAKKIFLQQRNQGSVKHLPKIFPADNRKEIAMTNLVIAVYQLFYAPINGSQQFCQIEVIQLAPTLVRIAYRADKRRIRQHLCKT